MTDRELFIKALDALEWNLPVIQDYGDKEQLNIQHNAINALRDRLAQPQRQWVGLTKEEAKEISLANRPYVIDMIAALEARLKEKNT